MSDLGLQGVVSRNPNEDAVTANRRATRCTQLYWKAWEAIGVAYVMVQYLVLRDGGLDIVMIQAPPP